MAMRTAFESLNQVNLQTVLQQKCIRQALALALEAVVQANSPEQRLRAWKLWFLLPRLLLHRPSGTRTLPKQAWHARMTAFQAAVDATPGEPAPHRPKQTQTSTSPPQPQGPLRNGKHGELVNWFTKETTPSNNCGTQFVALYQPIPSTSRNSSANSHSPPRP